MSLRSPDSRLNVIKSSWFTNGKLFSQHDGRVVVVGFSKTALKELRQLRILGNPDLK